MPEWIWMIGLFVQGFACICIGYRMGTSDSKCRFVPTQETWLELEKYRWDNPINGGKNND